MRLPTGRPCPHDRQLPPAFGTTVWSTPRVAVDERGMAGGAGDMVRVVDGRGTIADGLATPAGATSPDAESNRVNASGDNDTATEANWRNAAGSGLGDASSLVSVSAIRSSTVR